LQAYQEINSELQRQTMEYQKPVKPAYTNTITTTATRQRKGHKKDYNLKKHNRKIQGKAFK